MQLKSNKKDKLTTGCSCKMNEIFSSSPGNLNWGYFMYFGNISKHVQHFLENKHKSASLAAFIIMGNCSLGNLDVPPKQNPKKAENQQSDVDAPSHLQVSIQPAALCAPTPPLCFPSFPTFLILWVCAGCVRGTSPPLAPCCWVRHRWLDHEKHKPNFFSWTQS